MKYTAFAAALFVALLGTACYAQDMAERPHLGAAATSEPFLQDEAGRQSVRTSGKKAFALSLLLPGLGHRYVHGGDWDGWASIFAVADASLWAGLLGSEWHRDHLVESYTTLAASHADAQVDGKGRDFFLHLASYMSSDEFTEVQLRNRNWDQVGYAEDPAFQWAWSTGANFNEYRRVREDAESLRRRRTFIITSLVANRLIAGFTALRAAGRSGEPSAELSFAPPPGGSKLPLVRLNYTF